MGFGDERFARRVSWMPGAEGAPRLGFDADRDVWVVRLVVEVGWAEGGAMRRD